MLRYLIVVGNLANPRDSERISAIRHQLYESHGDWHCVIDEPGFYSGYFANECTDDSPIVLHNDQGIIFGSLYKAPTGDEPSSVHRLRSISRSHSEDIIGSDGRSLIAGYWGYYVAALRHLFDTGTTILRSPASPLACSHLNIGTLHVFFSSLSDLISLQLTQLSVNWDSITAQVVGRNYLTRETAITEVVSLECGEALVCTPRNCHKRTLWDPRIFLADKSLDDFLTVTRSVRHAVDSGVNALSSGHSRILVSLSGGLDSSIVASALERAPHKPALTAVNYYSGGCGDERYYANEMSRSIDLRLVEYRRNETLDLKRIALCNVNVRPNLNFSAPDVEARNVELARQLNASAIFDGELGDNIFGRVPNAGVLVEYLRQRGAGPRLLSLAMDYALLTRQSIWRTFALTYREHLNIKRDRDLDVFRRNQERYGVEGVSSRCLASVDAEQHHLSMSERYIHPWLKGMRDIAPGSDRLLFGLISITSSLHNSPFGSEDDPHQVSPLLSQPLVELAMRIPGYFHCKYGHDRAVARAAFADALPVAIVNRRAGKGGPGSWAKYVVENNIGFLRSFLLDGILVERGLVDRKKLEAALSPRITKASAVLSEIFAKLYIEAWLKNFQRLETRQRQPASFS